MSLHIVMFSRGNARYHEIFSGFGEEDACVPFTADPQSQEIQDWLDAHEIQMLKPDELFRVVYDRAEWVVDEDEREYILTENQTALFFLRFK